MSSSFSCSELLESLLEKNNLSTHEAAELMSAWLTEELQPVQTGALLAALRAKGLTGIELASMAKVLRTACKPSFHIPDLAMVDTCGTGGDGAETFNISTAVAFLAASCGANVAKHGNRSASGKVGSADVLEEIGINLKASLEKVSKAVSEEHISFLFAPVWHPALVNLAPLRKSLGVRTVFNLLGPLVNPLQPKYQVLGVAKSDLLDPMVDALLDIGLERAVVVHGFGGLDEASLEGPNDVRFLQNGRITKDVIDPASLGLTQASNTELKGGDVQTNADILTSILQGLGTKPQREVVALNNSLVLWAAGIETDLKLALEISFDSLQTGKAFKVMEGLKAFLDT